MTASPTRSPRRGVRGALSAINVPASGTKSAAKARRIVFDASKRKAQKQPSPQTNVRRSPPLQRRRVARVSYDPDDSADASFNPVVATETPQMVQPPDVAAITQSQASSIAQILDDVDVTSSNPDETAVASGDTPNMSESVTNESSAAVAAVLDDDANRTMLDTVDEPIVDHTRKGDNARSKKLGYNLIQPFYD